MEVKKDVELNHYSQPHVLQQRMREEGLTHDETVVANLSPVRLESFNGKMVMYFCPLQTIDVMERLRPGDGGLIPPGAIVDGFRVPEGMPAGLYNLSNVKLHSNGSMQVIATERTVFTAFGRANEPIFRSGLHDDDIYGLFNRHMLMTEPVDSQL